MHRATPSWHSIYKDVIGGGGGFERGKLSRSVIAGGQMMKQERLSSPLIKYVATRCNTVGSVLKNWHRNGLTKRGKSRQLSWLAATMTATLTFAPVRFQAEQPIYILRG